MPVQLEKGDCESPWPPGTKRSNWAEHEYHGRATEECQQAIGSVDLFPQLEARLSRTSVR